MREYEYSLFMKSDFKIGLVCISEILKGQNILNAFKTMTRKSFLSIPREDAIKKLSGIIKHNCSLTRDIITHCHNSGIKHYRISSNIMPLLTDPTLDLSFEDLLDQDSIREHLLSAGALSRKYNISISSHPDQFNVLASYNEQTVSQSIKELNHQARVLDMMGMTADYSSPMCLHLNLSPNLNKETVDDYVNRFISALLRCSPSVQNRLVLENEDKGFWNCQNLYEYFGMLLPLVYDNLHHKCNPSDLGVDSQEIVSAFKATWGHYTPIMHWSEGLVDKPRSHREFASHLPDEIAANKDCVWEFELKHKDIAIRKAMFDFM